LIESFGPHLVATANCLPLFAATYHEDAKDYSMATAAYSLDERPELTEVLVVTVASIGSSIEIFRARVEG
jgi:hypothetical protein